MKKVILKARMKRLFSLDGLALAPLWLQLLVILLISAVLVFSLAPLIGSSGQSFQLFVDPSYYSDLGGTRLNYFFGFIMLIIGLTVYGFIISVLSTALENFIGNLKSGSSPYRNSGQLLIINRNSKIRHILEEVNQKYSDLDKTADVVILLGDSEKVMQFCSEMDFTIFPYLSVYVKHGDLYRFECYEHVSALSALGLIILKDQDQADELSSDINNIRIFSVLTNNPEFSAEVNRRFSERKPFKCSIEITDTLKVQEIVRAQALPNGEPIFITVNPMEVISRVMSQSIVDISYYKIYHELLSYYGREIYFLDPNRYRHLGLDNEMTFEDLNVKFCRGVLLGFTKSSAKGFELVLAPCGRKLEAGDWLIMAAENENSVEFDNRIKYDPIGIKKIEGPSEIVQRKICMIGNHHRFWNLDSFLDERSKEQFHSSNIVLDVQDQYFDRDLIMKLKEENYDHVIINLEDKASFLLTLYILTLFGSDDPFLYRISTILEDPANEEILNQNSKYRNTILSQKLAGKYLTQVTFQKNIDPLFRHLTSPEGYEFNCLNLGTEIPRSLVTDKLRLKQLLLYNKLVYVGTVSEDKTVHVDGNEYVDAAQIIVLSHGKM
ncbi:MAG: hypothetical protein PHW04_03675 [Candidatus Wallbacteria bacterium]|nr:hypothetical protein [Candidatus Wallbacteria bacterium]